jgi:hypothetical protein
MRVPSGQCDCMIVALYENLSVITSLRFTTAALESPMGEYGEILSGDDKVNRLKFYFPLPKLPPLAQRL